MGVQRKLGWCVNVPSCLAFVTNECLRKKITPSAWQLKCLGGLRGSKLHINIPFMRQSPVCSSILYAFMAAFYEMCVCLPWFMSVFGWLPEMASLSPPLWHFMETAGPGCEEVPLCSQPALEGHRTQTHGGHSGSRAARTKRHIVGKPPAVVTSNHRLIISYWSDKVTCLGFAFCRVLLHMIDWNINLTKYKQAQRWGFC